MVSSGGAIRACQIYPRRFIVQDYCRGQVWSQTGSKLQWRLHVRRCSARSCASLKNLPWLIESTARSTTVKMNEHFHPSTGVRRYGPFLIQSKSNNYQIQAAKVAVMERISRLKRPIFVRQIEERRDCPWSHEWSGMFCSTPWGFPARVICQFYIGVNLDVACWSCMSFNSATSAVVARLFQGRRTDWVCNIHTSYHGLSQGSKPMACQTLFPEYMYFRNSSATWELGVSEVAAQALLLFNCIQFGLHGFRAGIRVDDGFDFGNFSASTCLFCAELCYCCWSKCLVE